MDATFLLDAFELGLPGQQIVDRFLLGYPLNGVFQNPPATQCELFAASQENGDLLRQRAQKHSMRLIPSLNEAVLNKQRVAIFAKDRRQRFGWVEAALNSMRAQGRIFVFGHLAESLNLSRRLAALAKRRNIAVFASTPLPFTWQLPSLPIAKEESMTKVLAIMRGDFPKAERDGLDFLTALIAKRKGGESGVQSIQRFSGEAVWRQADRFQDLLASAISRSNSPLGDSVKDGRTQNIVGLNMLPSLVSSPRAWILKHADGLETFVLALNGAVNDDLYAFQTRSGRIQSAQLYRPPAPNDHQYTPLAHRVADFFNNGAPPWPIEREEFLAGILERFQQMQSESLDRVETPELKMRYRIG